MKMIIRLILLLTFLLSLAAGAMADTTIRQKVTMDGQSFETIRMIKGSRQRTEQKMEMEGADFMPQIATITQCDLRRTISLNDRQKTYFLEPFAEENNARIESSATKPTGGQNRRGGTLTITYIVTDTGERKMLFGLQARHLKILQEIESSPDSCSGASRQKMEFDGWYVDFSEQFSCASDDRQTLPQQKTKPNCIDRIISKRSGTGKPGFLLNGTMKMFDENGELQMTQTTETLELSRTPLAAGLFDIPAGYKLVSSRQELYQMTDVEEGMKTSDDDEPKTNKKPTRQNPGAKSIGVTIVYSSGVKVNQSAITDYLKNKLFANNFNVLSGGSKTDYVLNVEIKKVKESTAGKIGGIFGKVTGVETKAEKTDVEIVLILLPADSVKPLAQSRIARKIDGNSENALRLAIDSGLEQILGKIDN